MSVSSDSTVPFIKTTGSSSNDVTNETTKKMEETMIMIYSLKNKTKGQVRVSSFPVHIGCCEHPSKINSINILHYYYANAVEFQWN